MRILSKPKTSLVRQCYDALFSQIDNTDMKYNWCRSLRTWLNKYNCYELLTNSKESLYSSIRRIVGIVSKSIQEGDIEKMKCSSSNASL